ncbi:hypothetical protein M433DRAFT_530690 [Acidomyces richmondensis BFW]|nr:MAG: hypothetical protein FE78DRAFT_336851 [Acidomyces sp. 'richmondensis']KYG46879.1 hypothetical protein M433DRAFT_530690 [Acidomyces richmondensis BFW]
MLVSSPPPQCSVPCKPPIPLPSSQFICLRLDLDAECAVCKGCEDFHTDHFCTIHTSESDMVDDDYLARSSEGPPAGWAYNVPLRQPSGRFFFSQKVMQVCGDAVVHGIGDGREQKVPDPLMAQHPPFNRSGSERRPCSSCTPTTDRLPACELDGLSGMGGC